MKIYCNLTIEKKCDKSCLYWNGCKSRKESKNKK